MITPTYPQARPYLRLAISLFLYAVNRDEVEPKAPNRYARSVDLARDRADGFLAELEKDLGL